MEKSGRRGKIPQSDWPLIMARYEKGETLASIARTYDCSPPAISYIVSRSKARRPAAEIPPPPAEPQLIKAHSEPGTKLNGAADHSAEHPPADNDDAAAPPALTPGSERHGNGAAPNGNGFAHERDGFAANSNGLDRAPAPVAALKPSPQFGSAPQPLAPANGEQRRRLHLALGGNGANGVNGHTAADLQSANGLRPAAAVPTPAALAQPPVGQPSVGERFEPRQSLPPRQGYPAGERGFGDPGRADPDAMKRKETGNFIDQELRLRVDSDIAAFLSAFDAALAEDTVESRAGLREATDRLLRAGARTRIELERLEARVPLSPRGGGDGGRLEMHWRHR